jgi:GNAT superfamily N-acetyltransferase
MLETFPRVARINKDFGVRVVDLVPDDTRWQGAFPVLSELGRHLDFDQFMWTYKADYIRGLCYSAVQEDHGSQGWLAVASWKIVDSIVTHANARGHGYGTILMEDIESVATGNDCNSLIVDLGSTAIGDAERGFFASLEMQEAGNQFVKALDQQN